MGRFRKFDGSRAPRGFPLLNKRYGKGLKFWTDFREGGGLVHNLVGKKQTGTLSAMEAGDWGNDNFGSFIDLDGVNEHVGFGSYANVIPTNTTPVSVLAWVRADAWPTARDAIVSSKNAFGTQGMDLRLENGGFPANGLVFSVGDFNTNAAVFAAADITITDLNLFGGTWDGTTLKAFVNGVVGGTTDTSSSHGTIAETLYLGVNFADSADRNLNGKIYDVKIFDRCLSEGEMYAWYNPSTRFDFYERPKIRAVVPVAPTPPSGRIMSSLAAGGGLAGSGGIAGAGGGLAA